jgi:hypothetical protein
MQTTNVKISDGLKDQKSLIYFCIIIIIIIIIMRVDCK